MRRARFEPALLAVLPLLLGGQRSVHAQRQAPPTHEIRPATGPITVDGRLVEGAWRNATPVPLPYEWFPRDNEPVEVATVCRIAFDDRSLLVGCRARDPDPEEIRARYADRDEIGEDDRLALYLDPFGDRRTAFWLAVNPLGVQSDGLFLQGDLDQGWDTIWESAGVIDDEGFTVELAIPFRSLRLPSTRESSWGLLVERTRPRSARRRFGNVVLPRNETCMLCRAARLVGLDAASGRDLEFDPFVTTTRTDRRSDPGSDDLKTEGIKLDAGISVRWRPLPNLGLTATANPDFNQVEADADQLDVNTRFALRFPEKRPFFLQGSDFFETAGNLDLVFTRTIADPVAGLKLSGKSGHHGVGIMATRDRRNLLILPGSQSSDEVSLDDAVTGMIARYRRDVGESSTLGGLLTTRRAGGYANLVGAVDAFLRPTRRQRLQLLAVASRTEYPEALSDQRVRVAKAFAGRSWFVRWDYEGTLWGVEASLRDVGPGLRTDAGFLPRVDLRGPEFQLRRTVWGDGHPWFDRVDFAIEGQNLENHRGQTIDRKFGVQTDYEGPAQIDLQLELARRENRFADRLFTLNTVGLSLATSPSTSWAVEASLELGDEIDSDNARVADVLDLRFGGRLRVGRHFRIDGAYRYQRLTAGGPMVFAAHLPQSRIEIHLGPQTFVRANLQYRRISRNPDEFPEPVDRESRRLFARLLFSYTANARTVFFAGYSDEGRGGGDVFELTRTERTVFFKLAYAWRP